MRERFWNWLEHMAVAYWSSRGVFANPEQGHEFIRNADIKAIWRLLRHRRAR